MLLWNASTDGTSPSPIDGAIPVKSLSSTITGFTQAWPREVAASQGAARDPCI